MKRFEFRLERVLWYREQRERLAEIRQKHAAAAVRAIEDEIAVLQNQLGETARLLHRQSAESGAAVWLACYAQTLRIGKSLELAEAKAEKAKQILLEANELRKQAHIEVEGILTLRHKYAAAHAKSQERMAQERADELAVWRWQSGNRAGR